MDIDDEGKDASLDIESKLEDLRTTTKRVTKAVPNIKNGTVSTNTSNQIDNSNNNNNIPLDFSSYLDSLDNTNCNDININNNNSNNIIDNNIKGLNYCNELLSILLTKFGEDCEPFLTEVDISEYPDYAVIISNPMDLTKVKNKLNENKYKNIFDFARDMRLIFHNAIFFNEDNSEINDTAKSLLIKFEDRFQKIINKLYPNMLCKYI